MWRAIIAVILGLMSLAACGSDEPGSAHLGDSPTSTSTGGGNPADGITVRVRGTLEDFGGGWQLCPGGVGPCWSVADGATDHSAGPVVAEGQLRGETISLDEVEPFAETRPDFPDPCEGEDLGRWDQQGDMEAIEAAAPSLAGTWISSDQRTLVMVVVDDVEGTRDRLAAAGHTGICVADLGFEHTLVDLQSAQAEIGGQWQDWAERGWHLNGSSIDVTTNRVTATFDQIDTRLRDELASEPWGSMVDVLASVEVLEGTIDELAMPSSDRQITITTQPRGAGGMDALDTFVLRYDSEAHCLWLEGAEGSRIKPIWPYGTTALQDPIVVFDGRGRPMVAVGQEMETGGGFGQVLPGSSDATDCGATEVWVIAPGSAGQSR